MARRRPRTTPPRPDEGTLPRCAQPGVRRDEIRAYVESQAHEEVVHLEKAASELVGPVRHHIWDVHCPESRWWVVTNPTNLYDQGGERSTTHPSRPERIYVGSTTAGAPVALWPLASMSVCTSCNAHELFLINEVRDGVITLRSLEEHSAAITYTGSE